MAPLKYGEADLFDKLTSEIDDDDDIFQCLEIWQFIPFIFMRLEFSKVRSFAVGVCFVVWLANGAHNGKPSADRRAEIDFVMSR